MSQTSLTDAFASAPKLTIAKPMFGGVLRPQEGVYVHYVVTSVPPMYSMEEVKSPEFLYSAQSNRPLKPGDIVELWGEGMSWRIVLWITRRDSETRSVFSKVLSEHDFTDHDEQFADLSNVVISYKPQYQWHIVRNGQLLKADFATEGLAKAWVAAKQGIGLGAPVEDKPAQKPAKKQG